MVLNWLDWLWIAAYFIASLTVGLVFSKKAGTSVQSFFFSSRSLPWWLVGTSMVATTFAADTPLAVTGMVVHDGIAGNWLWWNMALSGILTVFFYARLWRRAGSWDVRVWRRYSASCQRSVVFRIFPVGDSQPVWHHGSVPGGRGKIGRSVNLRYGRSEYSGFRKQGMLLECPKQPSRCLPDPCNG